MPAGSILATLLMMILLMSILTVWIVVILRFALGQPALPPNTPKSVPWGAGSVVLSILVWLAIQIVMPSVYVSSIRPRLGGGAGVRADMSPTEQMTLMAAINACVLVAVPLALKLTSGARFRDLGIVATGFFTQVGRGVFTYLLLAPLVMGAMLGSLLIWSKTPHPLETALKLDHSPAILIVLVLSSVVFAPLAEELIFRGVLLGWLTRLVLGRPKPAPVDEFFDESDPSTLHEPVLATEPSFDDFLDRDPHNPYASPATSIALRPTETTNSKAIPLVLANVCVSLVFAGLHAPAWPTPIPLFFLSLGLGFLYQRTGSLLPAMVLHMTFNGVSTLLMILTLGAPALNLKEAPQPLAPVKKVDPGPAVWIVDPRAV